jgi:hypothetical protein
MAAIQWGRKETIIFPPNNPIYSYGAVFLALVLTGFFVFLRFSFGQFPLQQYYTPIYVRAAAGGAINKTDKFQLLYVSDGAKAVRLATEDDVQEGATPAPGGKCSAARVPEYPRNAIYHGDDFRQPGTHSSRIGNGSGESAAKEKTLIRTSPTPGSQATATQERPGQLLYSLMG